ncbi:FAD-dependent oxidoreductase [Egicoccus halophilus]|uniref:Flavoprotein oxidoreductase n=1 Tax=Egicoccus halophilus TaxID=1670830 RepID=A0A8J3AFC2_9ACTN|nr:FAD-dependent oxidoreductase [Egicoccus halophilus]GGI07836.1 flavoprotein oxidoreductase [Egicoccus halophilus]
MTERLVVVGGDAAGMSAASQARRGRGPDALGIVVFERGHDTSYSACGIPYWIGEVVDDRADLVVRTPQEFRDRQAIDVRTRTEAVGVDTAARTVRVRDLDRGREYDESYDQLLLATGAAPRRPDLPGLDGPGVFGVQTLDDGQAILDHLDACRPRRAVVIGAGYIGLEMAEAMVVRGYEVDLVERSDRPMTTLDADLGGRVADAMDGMGIRLHLETDVQGVMHDGDRLRAVATSVGELPTDVVVLGLGATPDARLAVEAGVPVGPETGGVVVDVRQRTRVDGVWAAGDCAEVHHRVSRAPAAIALGTIANKTGRVAGINLGGGYATFPGVLGTAVTKVCGVEIGRTGLGERDAERAGYAPVTATVQTTTKAGYWPDTASMEVKVIAERRSGRLLGAQVVGGAGSCKRIDTFAAALWNEMTVEELLNVDLSYAPPFSPVWDPVLIGARKAWDAVLADLDG